VTECIAKIIDFNQTPGTRPKTFSVSSNSGNRRHVEKLGNGIITLIHNSTKHSQVSYDVQGPFPTSGTLIKGEEASMIVSTEPPISVDIRHGNF